MTKPSNSKQPHSFADSFTSGGQTQLHKFHMIRQVFGTTFKASCWIFLLLFLALIWMTHSVADLWFLLCYAKGYVRAHYLNMLPDGFWDASFILNRDGSTHTVSDAWMMQQDRLHTMALMMVFSLFKTFLQSLAFSMISLISISFFWSYIGNKRQKTKIVSGFDHVSPKALNKLIDKKGGHSPYTIGSIAIPKNSEFQHTLVTGTTGSGKSNMIHHLLHQIRTNYDQAIIVDTTGTLRSRFFDEKKGDILMNPLDPLSHAWNLWQELKGQPALADELAASLIPENGASPDTFWITSARSVLSASLTYLIENHQTTYHDLYDMLLIIPLKELHRRLQSTAAASLVDPQMDKTALGIRATLTSYVSCLSSLTEKPKSLSFLRFGSQEISSKPWLFLSCQTDEREYIKPLFSAWMALTIKGVMKRHLSSSHQSPSRTWIIIDELASLHKLPTLLTGLSEIRKYGGCFVLGFQDLSQIESIYGHHPTKTLSNLTGTKVIFRVTDPEIAMRMSRMAGESERLESSESISFGAHQMRDGVNLSSIKQTKPVIPSTDVMMLPDLTCFVKFPGDWPVSRVAFEYMT